MEDSKKKKEIRVDDLLQDLLERAKEMEEGIDDHQGVIIGDRLDKPMLTGEYEK